MEPVVHSGKWSTSSHGIGAFYRFSGQIRGVSGPLEKVDHWLSRNRGFLPVSGARAYGYFPVKVYRLIGTGAKPILSQISLDNYSQSAILKLNNKRKEDTPQMGAGDVFQSY